MSWNCTNLPIELKSFVGRGPIVEERPFMAASAGKLRVSELQLDWQGKPRICPR